MIVHRAPSGSGGAPRASGPWPRRLAVAGLAAAAALALWPRAPRASRDGATERLSLDLRSADLGRLSAQRARALKEGLLIVSEADEVPAELGHGERRLKAKLRLKGHFLDHLEDEAWSFGVSLSGEESLLGMTRFSLMRPERRHYADEWLILRAFRREGILSPRYEFVRLELNGRDLGLYALEEHVNSRGFLAAAARPDGPIVRFDDDVFWRDMRRTGDGGDSVRGTELQEVEAAAVVAFRPGRAALDPVFAVQAAAAKGLLEGVRSGAVAASTAFDVERTVRFLVLSELLMGLHGASEPLNLRFYYNPLAARLEPIGGDANESVPGGYFSRDWAGFPAEALRDQRGFHSRLFADRVFLAAYVRALEEVSRPGHLEDLLSDLGPELDAAARLLAAGSPGYAFPRAALEANRKLLRARVDPERALNAAVLSAGPGRLTLEAGNLLALPVEILGVSAGGRWAALREPLFLPARVPQTMVAYAPLSVPLTASAGGAVTVRYRVFGTPTLREDPASRAPRAAFDTGAIPLRRPSSVGRFAFLRVDEAARRIEARPGSWTLSEDLIVPPGYVLSFGPGVRLSLAGTAKIISRSPLDFSGSQSDPVRITSAGGAGQGLAVFAGGRLSRLRRVSFESLAPPAEGGWALSGAVTFHESPVELSDCRFTGSRAEDALHIVRSEFALSDVVFKGSRSDALDVDFGRGAVTRSSFIDSGNDGMDFSGSVATVRRATVLRAGDKGVSVGEASDVRLEGLSVESARIGVASKDRSVVEGEGLTLTGCAVGLAAYRKKGEFGPANLRVKGVIARGVGVLCVGGGGSVCEIDGQAAVPDPAAAERLLGGR